MKSDYKKPKPLGSDRDNGTEPVTFVILVFEAAYASDSPP